MFAAAIDNRVSGVGAAVRNAIADLAHDFLSSRNGRDRIAIGECLRERAQIRLHAHQLLDATASDPEPGLHLVDDHHDAVAIAEFPSGLDVVGLGGDSTAVAQDRLDQERTDLITIFLEDIFEKIGVVQRNTVHELFDELRHALAVRLDGGSRVARAHLFDSSPPEGRVV